MKLSVKATAIACGAAWGSAMLATGLVNLASPSYGRRFLRLMSSLYPGFHYSRDVPDVFVGAGYGFLDGAVMGALCAALYNQVAAAEATPRRS